MICKCMHNNLTFSPRVTALFFTKTYWSAPGWSINILQMRLFVFYVRNESLFYFIAETKLTSWIIISKETTLHKAIKSVAPNSNIPQRREAYCLALLFVRSVVHR